MAWRTANGSNGTLTAAQITQGESAGQTPANDPASALSAGLPDAFAGLAFATPAAEAPASSLPPLNLAALGDFAFTSGSSGAGTIVVEGPTVTGGHVAFVQETQTTAGTYMVGAGAYIGQQGPHGGATAGLNSNIGYSSPRALNFRPDQADPGHYTLGFSFAPSSNTQVPELQFGDVTVLGWNADSILLSYSNAIGTGSSTDIVISNEDMSTQAHSLPIDTTFTMTGAAPAILGVTVTEVPCFAAGTEIATPHGPRAVEHLAAGDDVLTHDGRTVKITWVGSRTVRCDTHPAAEKVRPVRIRRHAFGEHQPHRDLLLSPDHAIYLGGVLIPVCELVNGQTIVQEHVHTIRYVHIELPLHDIVLAENLPCETFLDIGNHSQFGEGSGATPLHPDFAATALAWEAACAPLQLHGPHVEAARALLAERIPLALAA